MAKRRVALGSIAGPEKQAVRVLPGIYGKGLYPKPPLPPVQGYLNPRQSPAVQAFTIVSKVGKRAYDIHMTAPQARSQLISFLDSVRAYCLGPDGDTNVEALIAQHSGWAELISSARHVRAKNPVELVDPIRAVINRSEEIRSFVATHYRGLPQAPQLDAPSGRFRFVVRYRLNVVRQRYEKYLRALASFVAPDQLMIAVPEIAELVKAGQTNSEKAGVAAADETLPLDQFVASLKQHVVTWQNIMVEMQEIVRVACVAGRV